MKITLFVLMAVVCSNAYGQGKGFTLLRRVTLAASCAASFWDYQTTAEGAEYGAVEGNGLMAGAHGRPRLGLILGVKAGLCGFAAISQETHLFGRKREKYLDPVWTAMNAGLAARFASAAANNLSVIRRLRAARGAPGSAAGTVPLTIAEPRGGGVWERSAPGGGRRAP